MKKFASALLALSLITSIGQTSLAATSDQGVQQQLEFNYADLLETKDIEYFLQKAHEFRSQNPSATLDKVNSFLKQEMLNHYSDKVAAIENNLDYPIPIALNDMNPLEKELYNENLMYALESLSCGYMAKNETERRYIESSWTSGNGDAFRHAYWNATMVVSTDVTWAERWATAHEDGSPYNDTLNRTMDMTNNSRGRQIVVSYPGPLQNYNVAIIGNVISWVDSGKMIRIVNNQLVSTNSTEKQ